MLCAIQNVGPHMTDQIIIFRLRKNTQAQCPTAINTNAQKKKPTMNVDVNPINPKKRILHIHFCKMHFATFMLAAIAQYRRNSCTSCNTASRTGTRPDNNQPHEYGESRPSAIAVNLVCNQTHNLRMQNLQIARCTRMFLGTCAPVSSILGRRSATRTMKT